MNVAREKINLTESLAFMRKFLGPNHEIVKLILGDKTPEARATELIEKTRITDPEINALLRAGGKAAVDVATDPMIVLARTLEPKAQEVDKRYADEVTTVQAAVYPTIGAAVMAVDGATVSSDATGTLRLSYGTVKSYLEDGKKVPPYTYIPGLYERSAQHNGEKPYDIAPSWVAAKSALESEDAVQHGHHQRHRRRQQRVGDGQQEGRTRRAGVRREPADAGRVLHLLRGHQPHASRSTRG